MSAQTAEFLEGLRNEGTNGASLLQTVVDHYRQLQRPLELFEALKMQRRFELQLPLVQEPGESNLPEDVDRRLEQGLLAACDEVGTMLLGLGRIRDGWLYLRPTGKKNKVAKILADVAVTEENAEELVDVLLYEGVDVGRGVQIILDRQGTCNSITVFDQAIISMPREAQRSAAAVLLEHVHAELLASVQADIANRQSPADPQLNLADLAEQNAWMFDNGAYHLDTSHLASTVRFARVLTEQRHLQMAWELTQYGRRLHQSLQYPGDEPFVDFYPAHASFFGALLGRSVESSLSVFQRKARASDPQQQGTEPLEVYVDLLDRVGRPTDALRAAIQLAPTELPASRLAPLLLDLANKADDYQPVIDYCLEKGDALGFAAARVSSLARSTAV